MKLYHPLGTTTRVASGYGWRFNRTQFHPAIDFACNEGTPVFAAADGVVIKDDATNSAGVDDGFHYERNNDPKTIRTKDADVEIQHPNGMCTRYSHLSSNMVKVGDRVKAGQQIGLSGNAGTGAHLHFELKKKPGYGTWFWKQFGVRIEIDPLPYLTLDSNEVNLK